MKSKNNDFKPTHQNIQWILFGLYFVIFILLIVLSILSTAIYIDYNSNLSNQDLSNIFSISGAVGDSINGIMTPFIGALAVITTFFAFMAQYQANQNQRDDIARERFETKFYEMIRLHKDNVSEIEIANKYVGRKAFVKMYYELRFIYYAIVKTKEIWNEKLKVGEPKLEWNDDELTELAYNFFFFGVGDMREGSMTNHHQFSKPFMSKCISALTMAQDNYELESGKMQRFTVYTEKWECNLETGFYPFDGHASKLAHYFRHLYQTIKFVVTDESVYLTPAEKYKYVKTIRAQLSNHEQTMIYYNSFFSAGKIWWGDETINNKNNEGNSISYFLDWSMIKNLPFNLTHFGKHPIEKFIEKLKERGSNESFIRKKMPDLFEWPVHEKVEETLKTLFKGT